MRRAKLLLSLAAISAACLLPVAANAADIPYSINLGPTEKLTGIVDQDDSSGDINSAKGSATGPVSGDYAVDPATVNAALTGAGQKLEINFNRRDQQVRARLDICASADGCTTGDWVTLWEKP
jgi:hypothetical protein